MGTLLWPAVVVFGMLALSSPLNAVCAPGNESCEPSENDARAKIERLLDSTYLTPHSVVSLEKLDGRSLAAQGRTIYEMRFFAVVNYSGDKLLCRTKFCAELLNYSVKIDEPAKKATIAGWLLFEKAGQGWR